MALPLIVGAGLALFSIGKGIYDSWKQGEHNAKLRKIMSAKGSGQTAPPMPTAGMPSRPMGAVSAPVSQIDMSENVGPSPLPSPSEDYTTSEVPGPVRTPGAGGLQGEGVLVDYPSVDAMPAYMGGDRYAKEMELAMYPDDQSRPSKLEDPWLRYTPRGRAEPPLNPDDYVNPPLDYEDYINPPVDYSEYVRGMK